VCRWRSGSRTGGPSGRSRTPAWTSTRPPSVRRRPCPPARLRTASCRRLRPLPNSCTGRPAFIRSSTDRDRSLLDCSRRRMRRSLPAQSVPSRTVCTFHRRRHTLIAPSSESLPKHSVFTARRYGRCLFLRLSVIHTRRVLYRIGKRHHQTFFSAWQPQQSSFLNPSIPRYRIPRGISSEGAINKRGFRKIRNFWPMSRYIFGNGTR